MAHKLYRIRTEKEHDMNDRVVRTWYIVEVRFLFFFWRLLRRCLSNENAEKFIEREAEVDEFKPTIHYYG